MALSNLRKEVLNYSKVSKNRNLEKTDFGLLHNYVFFIDKVNENKNSRIENNLLKIENEFKKWGRKFVYLPSLKPMDLSELNYLKFKNPSLKNAEEDCNDFEDTADQILAYFYYSGNINCGFLETNCNYSEISFYEFDSTGKVDAIDFIVDFINFTKERKFTSDYRSCCGDEGMGGLYSPYDIDLFEDRSIAVEDNIAEEIQSIVNQLNIIKEKGLLVSALPILEEMTSVYGQNLNTKKSRLYIDADFKILLPDFNIEIKLSHLTKSLYLLHIINDGGMLFEDLARQENELFRIYTIISNQADLDKLRKNVQNLIADKDAYYVHLSRIKSAFYRKMDKNIADHYIINGGKNEPKKISLDRMLVTIEPLHHFFKI